MFSKARERLGTAGLAVAIIALIAALAGGALAAKSSKSLTKAQIIALIKKEAKKNPGPKGDAGAPGAPGTQGPAGLQGPLGEKGAQGEKGGQGLPGTAGKEGEGVIVKPLLAGAQAECEETGGALVEEKDGSPKVEVCTGEDGEDGAPGAPGAPGPPGPEGSPWTAGGTLPPGATETGVWSVNAIGDANGEVNETIFAPLPFTIPLPSGVVANSALIHHSGEGDAIFKPICTGSTANPKAKPGELCVYYNPANLVNLAVNSESPVGSALGPLTATPGRSGGILHLLFKGAPGDAASGMGSYAVTGCSASLPEGDPNKCP